MYIHGRGAGLAGNIHREWKGGPGYGKVEPGTYQTSVIL